MLNERAMRLALVFLLFFSAFPALGQEDTTSKDSHAKLFKEDLAKSKEEKSKRVQSYLKSEAARSDEVDFKAPSIEVLKDSNQVKGTDGVVISGKNVQLEADSALYNSETKEADLTGDVNVTGNVGTIHAENGTFNLEGETGSFSNGRYMAEDGGYTLEAEKLSKLSEFEFELDKSFFSTCQCKDKEIPWSFKSSRCSITQESYAHCYGTRLEMYGVPVLYTPWFAFPVKTERASGLLVPRIGYSDQDGFEYRQPLYIVPDDYSDIMLTPMVESRTRIGGFLDYRRAFSKKSSVKGRFVYSDERPRDGDLRGTNIDGIYDPKIEKDRIGGLYRQTWSTDDEALIPTSFIADGHYVGDNLMLREIDDTGIGLPSSRFLTSSAVLRNGFGNYLNSEILSEYNQTMVSDQHLEFQRVPEARLSGMKSWRPFGYNPLGIKLVTRARGTMTQFTRERYYEGERYDFFPSVSVPLRYQNYFNSNLEGSLHSTAYNLTDRSNPPDPNDPNAQNKVWEKDPSRTVPTLTYRLGTGIDRVYGLDDDNWLSGLTSLGAKSQSTRLARVKHTIEPTFRYLYTPPKDQSDIPLFDSIDHIKEKNLIFYGMRTRLLGRFLPVRGSEESIPEITPEVEDLPEVGVPGLLEDLAGPRLTDAVVRPLKMRRGKIRELMSLSLLEGYDFVEARKNTDPLHNGFTDMSGDITLAPTDYLSFDFITNYNRETQNFTSWEADTNFISDRGDALTLRYTFLDKNANPFAEAPDGQNQIRLGAETIVTERLRLGLLTRYDSPTGRFIDSRVALRILSSCNCWSLDLGYQLNTNPDREKYLLTFTFGGLGGITQSVPYMGYRGDSGTGTE